MPGCTLTLSRWQKVTAPAQGHALGKWQNRTEPGSLLWAVLWISRASSVRSQVSLDVSPSSSGVPCCGKAGDTAF